MSASSAGYLANEDLAVAERRVERFFMNVVLVRVLFAHALVAAPRLALGWLAPLGRPVGDPRVGMTGIFMSLSRVLPDRYPLGDDVDTYIAVEHGFGHMLDIGVIQPRVGHLYDWSSEELALPGLRALRTAIPRPMHGMSRTRTFGSSSHHCLPGRRAGSFPRQIASRPRRPGRNGRRRSARPTRRRAANPAHGRAARCRSAMPRRAAHA